MRRKKTIRDVPESSARIVVYIVKFAKNDEKNLSAWIVYIL